MKLDYRSVRQVHWVMTSVIMTTSIITDVIPAQAGILMQNKVDVMPVKCFTIADRSAMTGGRGDEFGYYNDVRAKTRYVILA